MKANASIMHTAPNGLGGDPAVNQPPSQLEQLMVRREVIINTIRFFEEDGDTVAARAAMVALNELNATIAKLERAAAMPPAGVCPVCGRNLTEHPHSWQECAAEDAQEWREYQTDRADNARPYLS